MFSPQGVFLSDITILLHNLSATFKNFNGQFTWTDLVRFIERLTEKFYSSGSLTPIVLLDINTGYSCFILIPIEETLWMHCANKSPSYSMVHSFVFYNPLVFPSPCHTYIDTMKCLPSGVISSIYYIPSSWGLSYDLVMSWLLSKTLTHFLLAFELQE